MNTSLMASLVRTGAKEALIQAASLAAGRSPGFKVDTGPPVPGAPPPTGAVATQKEVLANEQKPQAEILDLLDQILPVDLTTIVAPGGKPSQGQPTDTSFLGVRLGDIKASLKSDPLSLDLASVLQAFGIKLPTNMTATDLVNLKKEIADKIVSLDLPPNVRGLFATVIQAADDTLRAQYHPLGVVHCGDPVVPPQTMSGGQGSILPSPTPMPPVLAGDLKVIASIPLKPGDSLKLDPSPVGPPIHIGDVTVASGQIGLDNRVVGPPVIVPSSAGGGSGTSLESGVVNPATNLSGGAPMPFVTDGTITLNDPVPVGAPVAGKIDSPGIKSTVGTLERQVVDALKVTSVSVQSGTPKNATSPILNTVVALQQAAQSEVPIEVPGVKSDATKAAEESSALKTPESSASGTAEAQQEQPAIEASPLNKKPTQKTTEKPAEGTVESQDDAKDKKQTLSEPQSKTQDAPAVAKTVTTRVHQTSKAAMSQPIQPSTRAEVIAKVTDQIQQMAAANGNGRTTIKLSPDDLGTITLVVKTLGDNVEARLTASDNRVRFALSHHRADLVQSVQGRGLSLNHLSVGHEGSADAWAGYQNSPNGNGSNNSQSQATRQDFERSAALWSGRADATLVPTASAASYAGSLRGLDTLA